MHNEDVLLQDEKDSHQLTSERILQLAERNAHHAQNVEAFMQRLEKVIQDRHARYF